MPGSAVHGSALHTRIKLSLAIVIRSVIALVEQYCYITDILTSYGCKGRLQAWAGKIGDGYIGQDSIRE